MKLRLNNLLVMMIVVALSFLWSGCAWEDGEQVNDEPNQETDGGDNLPDGADGIADPGPGADDDFTPDNYPPGPYGVGYNDTAENFGIEELLCDVDPPRGKPLFLSDFLDSKLTMFTVHAGWCPVCKVQASTMEADIHQRFKDRGLSTVIVLFQDEAGGSDRDDLAAYACTYKERYGVTFHIAIDPDAESMRRFFRPTEAGTPLNMLIDQDMVIRYKVEGVIPNVMEATIDAILSE